MLQRGIITVAVLLLGAAVGVAQDGLPPLPGEGPRTTDNGQKTTGQSATSAASGSALSVEAVGPTSIVPDQPLAYEIVARNVGAQPLSRVRVEDVLPPGAKLRSSDPVAEVQGDHLAWNLGSLDPNGERRIKVELQPSAAAGEIVLTPTGTFTLGKPWRTGITRPPFTVTQTASETAIRGGVVTFQIVVSNHGDQVIKDILLHDNLPVGLLRMQDYEKLANSVAGGAAEAGPVHEVECDIASLMPGETKTITLPTRAAQVGRQTNRVTATASGGWKADSEISVLVTETPPAPTPPPAPPPSPAPPPPPTLAMRLDAPLQALVGQDFDFRVDVSNSSITPASNVVVTQALSNGVELISASAGAMTDSTRSQVRWSLASLPAGQTQTLTLKLRGRTANDWTFMGSATASGAQEVKATHSLHLEGTATLRLEIVHHHEAIDLGAESVYEIRVPNDGTTTATGVHLSASIGEGLLVLDAEGPTKVAAQTSPSRTIVFQPLPQLPVSSDAVYRIRVRGVTPGTWSVMVQATADQLPNPLVQNVTTKVAEK